MRFTVRFRLPPRQTCADMCRPTLPDRVFQCGLPAPPGPDAAQVKALEDQVDKQKAANKQIEDQIAALKDRLRADVCTAKDPLGKNLPGSTPAPEGTLPERKT